MNGLDSRSGETWITQRGGAGKLSQKCLNINY